MFSFNLILLGILIGILASFTGLGGGFLVVPLLIMMGYESYRAVGTSFLSIFIISVSALIAHSGLNHVDIRLGVLLGIGGIIGAQLGSRMVEQVPTHIFNKIFALILVGLAVKMFLTKN
ncbi:MAG: sulfite exporter TauE/SafE family protein [Clostridiales bacterium]|nr:sulfite exporter TauE/SafE family protein [Clostridiales bacterium]MCF8023653.1 sulfite exporter TauE/SafE family protein [Clostridiales bacterium]